MHLHRIFLFLVLLLCVNPSQSILGWDAISFLSNALHDGFASETPSEKIYSRHKRDVGASASEYTVDIEISFPNASLLNSVRNYIKELKYPIMLNASDSINITSITLTTACEQIGSSLQCTCERGYTWPTNVCATYNSCAASLQSCGCITQLPPLGSYCQLQPVQTKLILRLDMEFNSSFTNPSSPVYIKVKGDLEKAFTENYKSLPGFQKAYVTAFRQGSVIADYTIVTGPTTETELNSASTLVAQSLSATYKLSDPPIQTVIEGYGTISISPSYIFDGDTASLECVMNISAANVTWDINGTKPFTNDSKHIIITQVEKSGSKSILNITAIKAADNGTYNCKMSEGPNLYVASTNVNIYTLNITVLNTTVICDGSEVPIVQCCTEGIDNKFSLTCSMSGSPSIVGVSRSFTNCWTYSVNPSADQCSGAADGLKVTYNYYCSTGNGAVRNQVVNVTFSVKRQLKILPEGNPYNISEGKLISLNCVSNGNIDGVTWEFSSGSINQSIDQKLYTKVASNVSLLSIPSATSNWQGNFHCKLSSDAQATASKIVQVYKLIQSSQIIVNPIKSFFTCGNIILFQCCVDDTTGYTATFNVNGKDQPVSSNSNTCFSLNYQLSSVCTPVMTNIVAFCNIVNLLNDNVRSSDMSVTEILVSDKNCENPIGAEGSNINISCDANQIGFKIKYCNEKKWIENVSASSCSSAALNRLSIETRDLSSPGANERIPYILGNLSDTVTNQTENITNSAENIKLVVSILTTIENAAKTVANSVMEDILESVSIIVDDKSTNTWNQVPDRIKESSLLLQSVERFARKLIIVNGEINITTSNVILKGITKSDTTSNYAEQFNFTQTNYLTGDVSIDKEHLDKIEANSSIVSIAYATLKDILQSTENASGNATVNGLIMTTTIGNISRENFQISMTFKKSNISLNKGDCVFWNFSLNNWDKTGCTAKLSSEFVECSCNHLTSFSILMSSSEIDDQVLDLITYIGVGISILSLIICIIIEGTVWKSVTKNKTSYMRHVCLVNIAVSLLIADIWFIVGSGVRPTLLNKISGEYDTPSNACVAATFFSHLFYLSVFFWMLTMGLILFYRLVYVLHDMSKTIMMSISFVMGYICPLVIAAITVAVTMSKPNQTYTAKRFCWLNTSESNAFIAFVVPALTILLINFIILAVVIVKLLRPTIGDKPRKDERNTLVQVTKSIAILTPLLGLTWGFGLGTVWIDSPKWIHGIFAALNSLQGLFILLFGCLLDKKVRDALFNTFSLSRWSSQQTKTTNASSSSEPPFSKTVFNLFGKKGAYNISSAQMSSSSDLGSNSYSLLN